MAETHEYTLEQLRCVASPARTEILFALRALERASVGEIANWTGRETTSLYYHLRALIRVGLVRVVEKRSAKRRDEQVFELIAPMFDRPVKRDDPEYMEAHKTTVSNTILYVEKNYRQAIENEDFDGLFVHTLNAYLTEGEIERLKALFEKAIHRARRVSRPGKGRRIAMVVAVAPVQRNSSKK